MAYNDINPPKGKPHVVYLRPYVDFRQPAPKPQPLYQRLTNLLTRSRAL